MGTTARVAPARSSRSLPMGRLHFVDFAFFPCYNEKEHVIARAQARGNPVFFLNPIIGAVRKSTGLPRQCAHWLAMTCFFLLLPNFRRTFP